MRPSQRVLVPFDRTRRTKRWHLADPPDHARRTRCPERSRGMLLTAGLPVALVMAAVLGAVGLATQLDVGGPSQGEMPMIEPRSGAWVCSEGHVRQAGQGGILFHVPGRCVPLR